MQARRARRRGPRLDPQRPKVKQKKRLWCACRAGGAGSTWRKMSRDGRVRLRHSRPPHFACTAMANPCAPLSPLHFEAARVATRPQGVRAAPPRAVQLSFCCVLCCRGCTLWGIYRGTDSSLGRHSQGSARARGVSKMSPRQTAGDRHAPHARGGGEGEEAGSSLPGRSVPPHRGASVCARARAVPPRRERALQRSARVTADSGDARTRHLAAPRRSKGSRAHGGRDRRGGCRLATRLTSSSTGPGHK